MSFHRRIRQVWALLLSAALAAPGLAPAQEKPASEAPPPAMRVTTRLVLMDVVVRDKAGQPVTDLTPSDFTVAEKGKAQKISFFSLERPASARPNVPPLPPNVYTNRPGYRTPEGPMTILLLDGMNTHLGNQAYARQQLLKYLATQHHANERMAVYALSDTLRVLQDFTTDPRLLRAALQNYAATESSALNEGAPRPPAGAASSDMPGGRMAERMAVQLNKFASEQSALNLERRIGATLAALRLIARAMAGYPGRKNLIWVSAAFPIVLFPDQAPPSLHATLVGQQAATTNVMRNYEPELKATEYLLSEAQVAVYPVDARGLIGGYSTADASKSGLNEAGLLKIGADYSQGVAGESGQVIDSQAAMKDVADETGGRAYYSRNDIDNAVALSVAEGSTYYLLGYYPEDKNADGSFRKVTVEVKRPELQVRHRPGYYAIDDVKAARQKNEKEKETELMMALGTESLTANMVVFDARITPPASGGTVTVEVLVNPGTLSTEALGDGRQQLSVNFYAAAFAPDGKVVAHKESKIEAPLTADQYSKMQQTGLPFQAQLDLKPGDYSVRVAIRDNRTGYFGTLDAPIVLK